MDWLANYSDVKEEAVKRSVADVLLGKEVYLKPHTTAQGLSIVNPMLVNLYGGSLPSGIYGANGSESEQVAVVFPGKTTFEMVNKRFVLGL